ncbi:MAG TPA: hypothetical protein VII66_10225 [Gemmatimonadaceae bacterium]
MAPEQIEQLIGTVVVSVLALGTILPIGKALARRIVNSRYSTSAITAPVDAKRMQRMEQAIEAVALEVERIAESQRFMTKLMSEGDKSDGTKFVLGAPSRRDT